MHKFALFFSVAILLPGCSPSATEIERMSAKSIFRNRQVAELVCAAETGNIQRIEELAKQDVNVNARGRYGVTPILRSIQAGSENGYKFLLKLGADPNALDQNGFSAMHLAAEKGKPFWVREALAHGGNPNLENTGNRYFPGQTPLFGAIWESCPDNARLLIAAGADVNHRSQKSGRPLDVAITQNWEIVLLLLEAGVKYRYENFDLVENMSYSLRNQLVGKTDEGKRWFHKAKEFLEKKGERFDRLEK